MASEKEYCRCILNGEMGKRLFCRTVFNDAYLSTETKGEKKTLEGACTKPL